MQRNAVFNVGADRQNNPASGLRVDRLLLVVPPSV
jgi:hypothetical protein